MSHSATTSGTFRQSLSHAVRRAPATTYHGTLRLALTLPPGRFSPLSPFDRGGPCCCFTRSRLALLPAPTTNKCDGAAKHPQFSHACAAAGEMSFAFFSVIFWGGRAADFLPEKKSFGIKWTSKKKLISSRGLVICCALRGQESLQWATTLFFGTVVRRDSLPVRPGTLAGKSQSVRMRPMSKHRAAVAARRLPIALS